MIVILPQPESGPETCATDPCVDENTLYCSDSGGSSAYKCNCNEGFDGLRCQHKCPIDCEVDKICISKIDSSNIDGKAYLDWECIFGEPTPVCEANPCCESGPTPLCCQYGVCSNENYIFTGDAINNNTDECQCLCTDNFSGLSEYSHNIKWF